MKKKFICRFSAMLIAVLCVCLLCVPAFASDAAGGELVQIVSETSVTFDEDGVAMFSDVALFSLGVTYLVVWNDVEYFCIGQDYSAFVPDSVLVGNGDLAGLLSNNEPFVFISILGEGTAVISGNVSATFSIYQVVESPSSEIFSGITTYADALRIQLSATSVIEVLAYIVCACVLGIFLWWAVRKAVKGIKCAYLRGKLRF